MSDEAGPRDSDTKQDQNLEGVSILTWTAEQVQGWLINEEYSECTTYLANMKGKNLATAKLESLRYKLGDQANRAWEAVEILLRGQHDEKLLSDKEFGRYMATRGTPVQTGQDATDIGTTLSTTLQELVLAQQKVVLAQQEGNKMLQLVVDNTTNQGSEGTAISFSKFKITDAEKSNVADDIRCYPFPCPEYEANDADWQNKKPQIIDSLRQARLQTTGSVPGGQEMLDTANRMGPWMDEVAKLYGFVSWQPGQKHEKLSVAQVVKLPGNKTRDVSGFSDRFVAKIRNNKPFVGQAEFKKRENRKGDLDKYLHIDIDQPILELEACRLHCDGVQTGVPLMKTNLDGFIFFKSAGRFARLQSKVIQNENEVAAYVHDFFVTCDKVHNEYQAAHIFSTIEEEEGGPNNSNNDDHDNTSKKGDSEPRDQDDGSKQGGNGRVRNFFRSLSFNKKKDSASGNRERSEKCLTPEALKEHTMKMESVQQDLFRVMSRSSQNVYRSYRI